VNEIYSLVLNGDEKYAAKFLGVARNELRICAEQMTARGLTQHIRHVTFNEEGVRISVLSLHDGNNRIIIDAVGEEEKKPVPPIRERILHCRIELTLADEIPEYDGDPAFFIFREIPVSSGETVPLHFIYNVDSNQLIEIDREKLPPETSLEDAIPIIEKHAGCKLVPAIVDDDDEKINPLELFERLIPENETDFNKLGYLDKFPDEENEPSFFVDGYSYQVLLDNLQWDKSDVYGKKKFELLRDLYLREPLEKFNWQQVGIVHAEIEMIHALESRRWLWDETETPIGDWSEWNTPSPSKNDCKITDIIETAVSLKTPFTFIVSDFRHIEGLGETSVKQDTSHKIFEVEGGVIIGEQFLSFPSYAVIPYYFEVKDLYPTVYNYGTYGLTPWAGLKSDVYGLRPADYLCGTNGEGISNCEGILGVGAPYCQQYYMLRKTWAVDWLLPPFRGDVWPADMSDYFTWSEYYNADKYFPIVNDWEPGGIFATPMNRIVVCLRSFYANTPDATQKTSTRKQYDVHWGGDIAGSSLSFSQSDRLPHINHYNEWPTEPGMFDPDERCSEKLSSFDTVDIETSQPLTTEHLPTYTTVKDDFVHVALLSSIYAESNKGELVQADAAVSDRLGGVPGGTADATTKRAFSVAIESEWEYKNVYGAAVVVDYTAIMKGRFNQLKESGDDLNLFPNYNNDMTERMFSDGGVYDGESCEASMIEAIYAELEFREFDKYAPVCEIKLESNLFERITGGNDVI